MPKRRASTLASTAGSIRNPKSAVGGPLRRDDQEEKNSGTFRFWHDERRFKGSGAACIVQEAMFEAGGVRTGGYPKTSPIPGPLGYTRPSDWDLLWSPARLALKALPAVQPGMCVSACPGLLSLTRKRKLPVTLRSALGAPTASTLLPESFVLPNELHALRHHVRQRMQQQAAAGGSTSGSAGRELWILKTAQHLGKGLKLVPLEEVVTEAQRPRPAGAKPFVLAQRYVDNPMLIDGRKFGIRVWVCVTGHAPLTAYLHTNGLVLFSTQGYDTSSWSGEGGSVAPGHVTNYAQNVDGRVWDLGELKDHMGSERFADLWSRIQRSAALVTASALGAMRAEHAALKVPHGATFELLGLDYLIDTELNPWLLEANGTPSLAVDHVQPEVEAVIREQKLGMVRDMVTLLGLKERFKPRYALMRLAKATAAGKAMSAAAPRRQAARDDSEGGSSSSEDEAGAGRAAAAATAGARAVRGASGASTDTAATPDSSEGEEEREGADTPAGGNGAGAPPSASSQHGRKRMRLAPRGLRLRQRAGAASSASRLPAGGSQHSSASSSQEALGAGSRASAADDAAASAYQARVAAIQRLRERLSPSTDAGAVRAALQELQRCGGFQPLMPLFPIPDDIDDGEGAAGAAANEDASSDDAGSDGDDGGEMDARQQQRRQQQTLGGAGSRSGGDAMATDAAAAAAAVAVANIPWGPRDLMLRKAMAQAAP